MGGHCVGGDGIEFVFESDDRFGVLDWYWFLGLGSELYRVVVMDTTTISVGILYLL